MSAHLYQSLLHLYPRAFRDEYGTDLTQHFDDLSADLGRSTAWLIAARDLAVTVPRYRLETIMAKRLDASAPIPITIAFAAAGIASALIGFYPGLLLLVAAAIMLIARRDALSRSLRTPNGSHRARRLLISATLGVIFIASLISYGRAIDEDHISTTSLIAHNVIGIGSMVGAASYLVVGIATRTNRTRSHRGRTTS